MVGSSFLDISFPIASNDDGLDVEGDGRAFNSRLTWEACRGPASLRARISALLRRTSAMVLRACTARTRRHVDTVKSKLFLHLNST
jgi:hypothetical protein